MSLRNEDTFRKVVILLLGCLILVVFSFACIVIWKDRRERENAAEQFSSMAYSGSVYLTQAAKMQYREHNPADVERLFRQAILSTPADADSFYAYFVYLKQKNCCQELGIALVQQFLKRNPRKFNYLRAGSEYLLDNGELDLALSYYNNIQESPKHRRHFISLLLDKRVDSQKIVGAIPREPLCEVVRTREDVPSLKEWCK